MSSAALLASLATGRGANAAVRAMPQVRLMTAARQNGLDGGLLLSPSGAASFPLPGRAHALTSLPDGRVLVVGRRPGAFAAVFDPNAVEKPEQIFRPVKGHRFAGHAVVCLDNRLATSEIDAETGAGLIVLRDCPTGAVQEAWRLGVEPHDLAWDREGERLIVAFGGIAQAADVKGPAMNLGHIESAILEINPRNGAVLARHALPADMRSLSLRHMAMTASGKTIAFGMQDQDKSKLRSLLGVLNLGEGIELFAMPEGEDAGRLRFYIGSVAIDASDRFVAATSPKGGTIGLWSLTDGAWRGAWAMTDVCGLAAGETPGTFWATSGHGDLVKLNADETGLSADAAWRAPWSFDNHLLRL